MKIFFPDNKSKLYEISNALIIDNKRLIRDSTILNIFETMVVLEKIYNNIKSESRQASFEEFCVLISLVQVISNNFSILFKQYKQDESVKEIDKVVGLTKESHHVLDRLSTAHVIDLFKFYTINCNKEESATVQESGEYIRGNILEYIDSHFFANGLFIVITEYCTKLLEPHGKLLESPQITGVIELFQGIRELISYSNSLNLPFNDLGKKYEYEYEKGELYKALSFYALLPETIYYKNIDLFLEPSVEAGALLALTYQICGNSLKLIRINSKDNNKWQFIIDNLNEIIITKRNQLAHKFTFTDMMQDYQPNWYGDLKTFLLIYNEEDFNSVKNNINLLGQIPQVAVAEEQNPEKFTEIDVQQRQHATIKHKPKELKEEKLSYEGILRRYSQQVVEDNHLKLDCFKISYKIMEILKDYYNNPAKRPISAQHIAEITEFITLENFNPNFTVGCKYNSPLKPLTEIDPQSEKARQIEVGKITHILDDNNPHHSSRVIKHRPIELLCQIASTPEELELIEIMMQRGISTDLRNQQNWDLVTYSLFGDPQVLEIILQNTDKVPLLKIMEGKGRRSVSKSRQLDEFNIISPLLLSIDLAREVHTLILLQYDENHAQRVIPQGVSTNYGISIFLYNPFLLALSRGNFKLVKQLLKYDVYKNTLFDKNSACIIADLMQQKYKEDLQAKETFLKCLVNHKLNLNKILIAVGREEYINIIQFFVKQDIDHLRIITKVLAFEKEQIMKSIDLSKLDSEQVKKFEEMILLKRQEYSKSQNVLFQNMMLHLREIINNSDSRLDANPQLIEDYQLVKDKILTIEEARLIDPILLSLWDAVMVVKGMEENIEELFNVARNCYDKPNIGLKELNHLNTVDLKAMNILHGMVLQLLKSKQLDLADIIYIAPEELPKLHFLVFNENYKFLDYVIENGLAKTLEQIIKDEDKSQNLPIEMLSLILVVLTNNSQEIKEYITKNVKLDNNFSILLLKHIAKEELWNVIDLKQITQVIDERTINSNRGFIQSLQEKSISLQVLERYLEQGGRINDKKKNGEPILPFKIVQHHPKTITQLLIKYIKKGTEDKIVINQRLTDYMLQVLEFEDISSPSELGDGFRAIFGGLEQQRKDQLKEGFLLGRDSQFCQILEKPTEEIVNMIKQDLSKNRHVTPELDLKVILQNVGLEWWNNMMAVGYELVKYENKQPELENIGYISKFINEIMYSNHPECEKVKQEINNVLSCNIVGEYYIVN